MNYLCQILEGLLIIHENKIIHWDIKTDNLLIHNGVVKIADFGISKKTESFTDTYCGTPITMAPEIINGDKYDQKTDIFSLGVIYYQFLHAP